MRWLVPLVYLVLAAATATAAVVAMPDDGAHVGVLAAEGGLELSNSHEDAAIFTATEIGPGDSTSGTVEIAASGGAAELTLTRGELTDTPGLGGGHLSAQLQLLILEPSAGATVYSGPLATMPPQQLGRLEPGTPRGFEFVATLPEDGATVSQNSVQEASTSVAFAWEANEVGEVETPGPADELDLVVTKVRHRIKAGRLLVWVRCDHACALAARGRLRVHDEDDRRAAKLRPFRRTQLEVGTQRLRIAVPRRLRRWLATDPSRERGRARVRIVAWDASGDRDRVRRSLRVRSTR